MRAGSQGNRPNQNMSQGSIGSMNLSHGGGYGSDAASQKSNPIQQQRQPDSILSQDVNPQRKVGNSSGGIEDLQSWLKQDSSTKYE